MAQDEQLNVGPDTGHAPYWRSAVVADDHDYHFLPHTRPSDTLVVAFAGLGSGDEPTFEFKSILASFHVHQLFLRDSNLQWFVPNRNWFVSIIRAAAARVRASRLVFLGASAGGWGALFFQKHFFPWAHCSVFSPQAFLDSSTRSNECDVSNFIRWEAGGSGD
jgi:hypothetical protein